MFGLIGVTSKSPTHDVAVPIVSRSAATGTIFLIYFFHNPFLLEIQAKTNYYREWTWVEVVVVTIAYFWIQTVIIGYCEYI